MKWSKTLIPTLRQVPAEAEVPSHRLMLRAGYIHRLGSGLYDYLPLGLRSLHKAMAIIRQEMEAAGGVEVLLPALQPIELWERTGRRVAYGPNLFVIEDRHGRSVALGPTHEEVITELVGSFIESYKQLPLTLYQIQTKFRDEFRPRFGVLRSREFHMKDAYSFHLHLAGDGGLEETYQKQFDAYCRILQRCGLPYEVVEAESGPIGGSASHEFMVPAPTGEDLILKSDKGNYAANVEKCEIGQRASSFEGRPTGALERVHTPGCGGIDDVIAFFKTAMKTKLKPQNMLKTLVCQADGRWVVAVVRADHEVNEAKLRVACGQDVQLCQDAHARAAGFNIGFVGPHVTVDRPDTVLVVDPDAAQTGFWVTGANKADDHVKHFDWKRDVIDPLGQTARDRVIVTDIRNATEGDPSPMNDGGVLRATKGIEIGHVFKLGDKYSQALKVSVLDENNERQPLIMGCYGIGVNRILAAAIEREGGYDENGLIWPASIAPYTVLITPIQYQGAMRQTADDLARELEAGGLDVLIDDRAERPGVKFKDADLIGIPLRITIGDKALATGQVEIKPRRAKQAVAVPIEEAVSQVAQMVHSL